MKSGDRVYYSIYSEDFDYIGPSASGLVRRIKTITPLDETENKFVVTLVDLDYVLILEFKNNNSSLVGYGFHKNEEFSDEEPTTFDVILSKDHVIMQRNRVLYLKRMIARARAEENDMSITKWEFIHECRLAEAIAEYEEYRFDLQFSEYRNRFPEDFI